MKNIFTKILLSALVAVFSGVLTGCNPEPEVKPFSVSFKEAGPGYVTLLATVPRATKCAYTITTSPRPMTEQILNMTGEELYIYSDGEVQLCDFDIEENTKYYVYLVAILGEGQFSKLYEWEFETGTFVFEELATVVSVAPDGYKMRITVPESVRTSKHGEPGSRAIRYTQSDIMMYNTLRAEGDYSHLLHNAGEYTRSDTTLTYSDLTNIGPTGIDSNEDGKVDSLDVGMRWNPIAPGEPVVYLAGEFEWMEIPEGFDKDENYVIDGFFYPAGWDPGYYLPCIDSTKYWSYYENMLGPDTKGINILDPSGYTSELDYAWTGAFQRKVFRTRIPAKLDAKIDVQLEELRSVEAMIRIIPDEKVYRYLFMILEDGIYNQMMDLLEGNEDYRQWATTAFYSMYNFGAKEVVAGTGETSAPAVDVKLTDLYFNVTSETKYHVLVTGMSGEIGTPQCFTHYSFSTPKKTKTEGPEVVVTALEELSTPYSAAFNIKCTTVGGNSVDRCYYGANYYKDWVLEVNSGKTYESLGQSAQFSEAEVRQINSSEGLTIHIPSIDGETTRLVVVAFNDENISNGVDEWRNILDCPAVAEITTPYMERDIVSSPLLDTDVLVGDWTMTATDVDGNTASDVVSIKRGFVEGKDYPAELPADIMDIYKKTTKWTEEEIYGYFEEFKMTAENYNEYRLRGQNKLLVQGWIDNDTQGRTVFMSPWDMFKSEEVVTVDVPSLFSEFGPKFHITVDKDVNGKDSLCVVSDYLFASPAINWSQSLPFYIAGRANQETNNTLFYYGIGGYSAPLVFPVELSEDKNTITIKPIVNNGLSYYPNLIGIDPMTGRYVADKPLVSEIVMTRGGLDLSSEAVAVKSSARKASAAVKPASKVKPVVYKRHTDFSNVRKYVEMEIKALTPEKYEQNVERYKKLYFNNLNK